MVLKKSPHLRDEKKSKPVKLFQKTAKIPRPVPALRKEDNV